MTPYLFALLLFFLAVLGMPLFSVILGAAMLGFYFLEVDLSVVAIELYRISDTPLLLALNRMLSNCALARASGPLHPAIARKLIRL